MTRATPSPMLPAMIRLARALCADPHILVEEGNQAHYDAARHAISIGPPEAITGDRWRGLIAHECGHALITRYNRLPQPTDQPQIWFALLNALEEGRIETWLTRRFSEIRPWLAATAAEFRSLETAPPALFVQFTACAVVEHHAGLGVTTKLPPMHPHVVRALRLTRRARRAIMTSVPDPDLPPLPKDERRCATAYPRDAAATITPVEASVRDAAHRAWRIAHERVWPLAFELVEIDIARVVRGSLREEAIRAAIVAEEPETGIAAAQFALMMTPPEIGDPSPHEIKAAGQTLWVAAARAYANWIAARRSGRDTRDDDSVEEGAEIRFPDWLATRSRKAIHRPPGRGAAKHPVPVPRPARPGEEGRFVDASDERQVRALGTTLERFLGDRRSSVRSGFRSGGSPELRRLMRFEIDQKDDRIWRRLCRERRRDGTVGLLVDLSGSMSNDSKIGAAISGTLLLAAAASRVGFDLIVDGFQDVLIPFVHRGERFDATVRSRISEMSLEVIGKRPGGNNEPGHNDDGPCLEEFAAGILPSPGARNLILVISDGHPAGRRSTDADLHRAVATLRRRSDLTVIGLGLGAGTGHVRNFYPDAIVEVPVAELPDRIVAVMRRHFAREG